MQKYCSSQNYLYRVLICSAVSKMYRYPDQAFGIFDFIGKGYVTAEDVASNPIIYK